MSGDASTDDTMAGPEPAPPSADDTMAAPERTPSGADDTMAQLGTPTAPRSGSRPRSEIPGELAPGTVVGRYVILSRLGAGGMGVVHAAYDPELDRKVAVKLLYSASFDVAATGGHTRLLREAQAMAQLSHPNVVTVYDVGEHDGRVYVAMELVQGTTLNEWRAQHGRRWPDVLDMLVQAGRGLAAAHARGLVHRDFKPDNVMVGDDGRARVMDFGLARSTQALGAEESGVLCRTQDDEATTISTAPRVGALASALTLRGSIMGTPAYMAPEQHWGRTVGAPADQFAYCVTLWEALFGKRPFSGSTLAELTAHVTQGERAAPPSGIDVPTWLRRACDRGLAIHPEQRWPDLQALLDVLVEGRARARRTKTVGGLAGLALVGAAALGMQRWSHARAIAACEAEGADIESIWNDGARADLHDALLGSGLAHAETTAQKVIPWLDDAASSWASARMQACVQTTVDRREGWNDDVLARAHWCLDERRSELTALLGELNTGDARAVNEAIPSVSGLPPVDACLDRDVLLRLPAPPTDDRERIEAVRDELARARALDAVGDYDDGLVVARAAVDAADATGWPPLAAAARARLGSLLTAKAAYDEAETVLEAAYFAAVQAGAPDVATTAADTLTYVISRGKARHSYALHWSKLADLQRAALPDPSGLRGAAGVAHLAIVREAMGEYDEARALYEQVLAAKEAVLGPDHFQIAQSLNNLANVLATQGDLKGAAERFERALAIKEAVLGPNHPSVAIALNNLARTRWATGDQQAAVELLERALIIKRAALGPEHADVFASLTNLALVNRTMGNAAHANALSEEAIAIGEAALGPDHPQLAQARENLGHSLAASGDTERARALFERALASRMRSQGAEHPQLLGSLRGLADLALARGDVTAAVELATRAVRVGEAGSVAPDDLAEVRFVLARALWEQGSDRRRALALATQAEAALKSAEGEHDDLLAAVHTWLSARAERDD